MNGQECLEILRGIKDVAFATVDAQGRPKVRIIDVMLVREGKLYFVTARGKEFHREITADPHVAITGLTREYLMVRLDGVVKRADQRLLGEVFEQNPSMNGVYPGVSREILDVFCMEDGQGEVFDLGTHPIHREGFVIGNGELREQGFWIGEACIACGACKEHCPQGCIDEGEPFRIRQEACLRCGLCAEVCPVGAIRSFTEALQGEG